MLRALCPLSLLFAALAACAMPEGPSPALAASSKPEVDPLCGPSATYSGGRCVPHDPTAANVLPGPTRAGGDGEGRRPAASAESMGSASESHVQITEVKEGDGPEALAGSFVSVHYVGKLTDGTEFDNSRKRGRTLDFRVGSRKTNGGEVIRGFDDGVRGMKVGGVRKVTVPPELGYGRRGVSGVIPPNATLQFEIELMAVE